MVKRESGLLLHISSLPSRFGIGDFGKGAYEFLDFLVKSKQTYWQILPLGITGYGDSPYQSFSAYAGNPYFIDLDEFVRDGSLTEDDIKSHWWSAESTVDYGSLYVTKYPLLKKAFATKKRFIAHDLENFSRAEGHWLDGFALFMALKDHFGGKAYLEWDEKFRDLSSDSVKKFAFEHKDDIDFWKFTQLYFYRQWFRLKERANNLGIKIIGDLPIYVSEDSSDLFQSPWLFNLDGSGKPVSVAGCPPDMFSPTGQLWGNPIYKWQEHEKEGFRWWKDRIRHNLRLYDIVRIDHFRGFEAYWDIPYGDKTAVNGQWIKAPGKALFDAVEAEFGKLDIIAEDLGVITPEVDALRLGAKLPGMKVLEFAFSEEMDSQYLPHRYEQDCVAYTGTHDNDTVVGWLEKLESPIKEYAIEYMNLSSDRDYWGVVRTVWASPARIAICQVQDILGSGGSDRMNMPSTTGDNWKFRVSSTDLSDELAEKLARMTEIYARSRK